jgi:hypothetical protein
MPIFFETEQVARTVPHCGIRVFSVAIIATMPYSIVRQPTDRNSGVLFFPIDISLSPCACSGGEKNSSSLTSPCWREPSTERGHCTLFTCHLNPVRAGLVSRPEDWSRPAGSSYNEYAGRSANEQKERCGLIVDRLRMPSDPHGRI